MRRAPPLLGSRSWGDLAGARHHLSRTGSQLELTAATFWGGRRSCLLGRSGLVALLDQAGSVFCFGRADGQFCCRSSARTGWSRSASNCAGRPVSHKARSICRKAAFEGATSRRKARTVVRQTWLSTSLGNRSLARAGGAGWERFPFCCFAQGGWVGEPLPGGSRRRTTRHSASTSQCRPSASREAGAGTTPSSRGKPASVGRPSRPLRSPSRGRHCRLLPFISRKEEKKSVGCAKKAQSTVVIVGEVSHNKINPHQTGI